MEKITVEEIRKKIKFIENSDKLKEIQEGFSEAYKYKIEKANQTYFLKLLKNRENATNRIQEILEVYKKSGIDTVNLVDCGILEEYDLYYCIYDWIDGVRIGRFDRRKGYAIFL